MQHQLDHVGWITNNLGLFEEFWCRGLGFSLDGDSVLSPAMSKILFGIEESAYIRRYVHTDWSTKIEIHQFQNRVSTTDQFQRSGINHICLNTGGPASRQAFIDKLQQRLRLPLTVVVYDNPGGWKNIFLRDFEGNWVELRENLN